MTSRRWPLLAGLALLGVLALAVVAFTRGGGSGDAREPAAATAPAEPQAEEAPAEEPPSEAPTVRPYATKIAGRTVAPEPGAAVVTEEAQPEYSDGCDHNYGDVPLCVPWAYPQGVRTAEDRCAWLRGHGFTDVPVRGVDRQGLDADKNGVACDQG